MFCIESCSCNHVHERFQALSVSSQSTLWQYPLLPALLLGCTVYLLLCCCLSEGPVDRMATSASDVYKYSAGIFNSYFWNEARSCFLVSATYC